MPDPLQTVRDTRNQLDTDQQRLRAAIADARAQGHSASSIAQAAGLSRQRVYQILWELESEGVAVKPGP